MPSRQLQLKVGVFSAIAFVLLVVAIGLLARGSFFKAEEDYVLYFEGSVTGLSVGAPVVFRGVPLGKVMSISLVANNKDDTITIPVGINIVEENVRNIGAFGRATDAVRDEMIRRMIERGLRARIATVSFLTGQARVDLDFFPATPARYHSTDIRREIPTLSSPLEEFSRALSRINIEEIVNSLLQTLANINQVMTSKELRDALIGFKQVTEEAAVVMQEMPALMASARQTLQQLEAAADRTAQAVPKLGQDMSLALDRFNRAAESAEKFFLTTGQLTSPNSAAVRDVQSAMKELAEAARAVRSLAKSLERNPESLLRGRGRQ